jgi:hypothetical protein
MTYAVNAGAGAAQARGDGDVLLAVALPCRRSSGLRPSWLLVLRGGAAMVYVFGL